MNSDLRNLTNEVRMLFHSLVEAGDSLHKDEPITMGMRGVLEFLLQEGASTVPDMARERHVTRQHIQALVNGLLETGCSLLVPQGRLQLGQRGLVQFQLPGHRAGRIFYGGQLSDLRLQLLRIGGLIGIWLGELHRGLGSEERRANWQNQ